MKRLFLILAVLMLAVPAWSDNVKTTDIYQISESVLDSAGVTEQAAESVHVMTYFGGYECIDAWYNAADDECKAYNGHLFFFDAYGDLDADSGDGQYFIQYEFIDSGGTLYSRGKDRFTLGNAGDTNQVDLTNYSGTTPLVAAQIWGYWINYSDFTHDLANDSAQAAWLAFNAGCTSGFFYDADALQDSLNNTSLLVNRIAIINRVGCDSTYSIYYPLDSNEPKDSVEYYCLPDSTLLMTMRFIEGSTGKMDITKVNIK